MKKRKITTVITGDGREINFSKGNYYISDTGLLYKGTKRLSDKPSKGYIANTLKDDNGLQHRVRRNRLVGLYFCDGHSEDKNICNHIDENKANNKASNLEWCSQRENNIHSIKEYDSRPRTRAEFKKYCKANSFCFDDFVEEFFEWRPRGKYRERLYTYIPR